MLQTQPQIKLFGPEAFEGMHRVGRLTATILDQLTDLIKPGVTTQEIDDAVMDFACANNAVPATLNYRGYTKSSCTSINHVVCHGIPNTKPLRQGDIVNVDVTLILDGWHGDSSRMYPVGTVKRAPERLMEVTYLALMRGIAAVKPGARTGDIGAAIQEFAEAERCSVVRDFCGHGIGDVFSPAAQHPALWAARRGHRSSPRHDLHRRADDQSWTAACEDPVGRMDGRDPRPVPFGTV